MRTLTKRIVQGSSLKNENHLIDSDILYTNLVPKIILYTKSPLE